MHKCAQFRDLSIIGPMDRFLGMLKKAMGRSEDVRRVLYQAGVKSLATSVLHGHYDFLGSLTSTQRKYRERVCAKVLNSHTYD